MYLRTLLPNGIRLLTCPMPHVRSATVCCYIRAGSRREPAGRAGLAHFLEHMLFKGTAAYPHPRLLSEAIEGVGGILDATTSPEITAYWAKVPEPHFLRAVEVLGEMLRRPLLLPGEVEKERRVIVEELRMIEDAPLDLTFQLIGQVLWPEHALGREVAGTFEGVAAVSREDLERFLQEEYLPAQIVAVVAGSPMPEEVEPAVQAALGDLDPRPVRPTEPAPETTSEPRLLLRPRETEQVNLCLAFPALSYFHPDRYVLRLLNTILGNGMSSRLFQAVREERALAYNIFSGLRQYADDGAVVIYAGTDPERLGECLQAIWDELERLYEEPPEEELVRAKEYNKGRILLRMEDSYGVAGWYGMQEVLQEEVQEVEEVIAEIEAVRPAEIARLARDLFRRERIRLAVVGPLQEETPLCRALGITHT